MDMKTELEKVEELVEEKVEKIENVEKIKEKIKEKVKSGEVKISEISTIFSEIRENIQQKLEEVRKIESIITSYKELISRLEKEKSQLREEIRELNIALSELTDEVKAIMGFAVSTISGKPITNSPNLNRGKGQRVYVKTTELGIREGLQNICAEFDSMAKALYALKPEMHGKRTDFRRKLQALAEQGLIELQYL